MAEQVVSYAWSKGSKHPLLDAALNMLGMTLGDFGRFQKEAAKVSKGRCRLSVLTPTGGIGRK